MLTRLRVVPAVLSDEHDVRQAYEAHGAELFRFSLRALGDRGHAQDAVQETFVRAWRSRQRFDPELASLRVWLFAIARNVVIDDGRRERARPGLQAEAPSGPTEEAIPDASERLLRGWVIEEALRRIGEDHRRAIVETYLRDRPYADVAVELDIPVATLRTRVFYALKALRVTMEEMEVSW
ncbi:MAG: sigma-70 family RNA polymerase sigma factor [Actinomycetota bacterium]|nr:sigma-70 family RNA polymerase sigma factor [Actinomycetota bacterium]